MGVKPYHLLFGSFFAMTAVIFGALGAHALKEVLSPDQMHSFETAICFQMYHALILVMIALKGHAFHLRYEKWIVTMFGLGIVLFSFSIYALVLQDVLAMDFTIFRSHYADRRNLTYHWVGNDSSRCHSTYHHKKALIVYKKCMILRSIP